MQTTERATIVRARLTFIFCDAKTSRITLNKMIILVATATSTTRRLFAYEVDDFECATAASRSIAFVQHQDDDDGNNRGYRRVRDDHGARKYDDYDGAV